MNLSGTVAVLALAAAGVLVVTGVLVVGQYVLPQIYNYGLTSARFEVRLFNRFPIYTIALHDITSVAPRRFAIGNLAATFTTLRFGNRIFGRAIVIERRNSFPRYLVVTPDDPDCLLADLRARIVRPLSETK